MDGIDTITTSGGASISNIKYTGNPLWVNKGNQTNPFDLYSEDISTLAGILATFSIKYLPVKPAL